MRNKKVESVNLFPWFERQMNQQEQSTISGSHDLINMAFGCGSEGQGSNPGTLGNL